VAVVGTAFDSFALVYPFWLLYVRFCLFSELAITCSCEHWLVSLRTWRRMYGVVGALGRPFQMQASVERVHEFLVRIDTRAAIRANSSRTPSRRSPPWFGFATRPISNGLAPQRLDVFIAIPDAWICCFSFAQCHPDGFLLLQDSS